MEQRKGTVRVGLRGKVMYTLGKGVGRVLRSGRDSKPGEKMAATTVAKKGGEQAFVSVATILAVVGTLRVWKPEWLPWPKEEDTNVAGQIVIFIGSIAWAVGMVRNIWKNRSMLQEGVSVKRTLIVLLCVGLLGGCASLSGAMEQDVLPTTVSTCNLEVAKAELRIESLTEARIDFEKLILADTEDRISDKVEQKVYKAIDEELQYLADRIVRINAIKATLE